MFELIRDAIAAHQTIILHRHTNPDGDALGSQIGLKHLILANYPDKTVHMVGDGAGRYGFMEDSIMDEIPDSAYIGALAIVLDTSAKSLISDTRYTLAAVRPARSCAAGSFCRTASHQQLSPAAANTAFIFRGCKRRFPAGFSSPRTGPAADSRSALAAVQRPLHRQHPDAGAALPVFVALIPKRNLPLKSVILLHRSMAAARKTRRPPSRSLIRNFLSDDHPFVMGPRISYPLCSLQCFHFSLLLFSLFFSLFYPIFPSLANAIPSLPTFYRLDGNF